jgi:hypothetical protein
MNYYFNSPTNGILSLEDVVSDIAEFISEQLDMSYKLIIGTDSNSEIDPDFITAITIHRAGRGGRYYWVCTNKENFPTPRQRIYEETMMSLNVAVIFREKIEKKLAELKPFNHDDLEIHTDIGQNGDTKDMIKEVVGMVRGNGFLIKIKPESFGASVVADKYT